MQKIHKNSKKSDKKNMAIFVRFLSVCFPFPASLPKGIFFSNFLHIFFGPVFGRKKTPKSRLFSPD